MELTPDTDPARLSRLSLPDRSSTENRRELERLANVCTPRSVAVSVTFTESEASCRPADGGEDGDGDERRGGASTSRRTSGGRGSRHGIGTRRRTAAYEIRLPTERVEQGRTNMHPRRWDRRVQVGLLFHELGHVLHSDLERFGEWQTAFAPEWRELFRTVYNAAEDGVIEAQMAAEFDVREDFVLLNDAFARREQREHRRFVQLFETDGTDGTAGPSRTDRSPADGPPGERPGRAGRCRSGGHDRRGTPGLDPRPDGPQSDGCQRDTLRTDSTQPSSARQPERDTDEGPPASDVARTGDGRLPAGSRAPAAAATAASGDSGPPLEYTVKEALGIGLLDHGFGDSGRFAALLDPANDGLVVRNGRRDVLVDLAPVIAEYMDRMLAEPDGTRRVDLAGAFLRTIRPTLEALPPAQLQAGQRPTAWPRDATAVAITDPRPADQLPGVDDETDGRDQGSAEAGETVVVADPDGELPGRLDGATVRRAARVVRGDDRRALDDGPDALQREAERLLDLVRESDDLDLIRVPEPEPGSGDRERWEAAARDARRLESTLASRLRRERRARPSGGHRVGALDSRRVVAVRQGSTRVFERIERGDEKDYSCILLLDRSGSMSGTFVEAAENATARLALAMDGVGVDVSVLSVLDSQPCLELPFGGDPRDHVDRLMSRRSGGTTPLAPALTIARERVRTGRGHQPLVFVVTDGAPDSESQYQSVLDACNFPVFGVYLTEEDGSAPDHSDYFDGLLVTGPSGLGRTLTEFVKRLFRRG